jgi:3-methyladenine DNA glycosylase AlkD
MQAYMRSEMPFFGTQALQVRDACREAASSHPLEPFDVWRDTLLALWREATYREERYAAIRMTDLRSCRKYRTVRALPLYEEMIATGAWWDFVDPIASRRLGELVAAEPKSVGRRMRRWARSRDLWMRRAAILCQLRLKDGTDRDLLRDCIVPSLGSREFFLRKGIGWALREFAKTDARWVHEFVREHEATLSRLSKTEALRHLDPDREWGFSPRGAR